MVWLGEMSVGEWLGSGGVGETPGSLWTVVGSPLAHGHGSGLHGEPCVAVKSGGKWVAVGRKGVIGAMWANVAVANG